MRYRLFILSILAFTTIFCGSSYAINPESRSKIDRGVDLFNFGRWSDARITFEDVKEELGTDDKFQMELVECYLAACGVELDVRDAAAALKSFEQKYPASLFNNDIRFSLGSFYCVINNLVEANRYLGSVDYWSLTPIRREQYDIRMGYVKFMGGDYATATTYLKKISTRSSYADHATYYLAYIDYMGGNYRDAKAGFVSLQSNDAYAPLVPYYLLQIEFKQGNYKYIVDSAPKLIENTTPEYRSELNRLVAESYFHLGEYDLAIKYMGYYLEGGGVMERDENYLLGFSLYRTVRYVEAVPYLRSVCGADDSMTQNASFHLADCYLKMGEKSNAMKSFAMASNDQFNRDIAQEALFNYGKLQYELGGGQFNESINVLSRYITKYPKSKRIGEVRELLIAAYYNSSNYDAAYNAIKLYPNPGSDVKAALQKITYFRGLEHYNANNFVEADRYLKESSEVAISPKYVALNYFWRGEIAFAQQDMKRAQSLYESYIKRAPKGAREYQFALYNLGYCALSLDNISAAKGYFLRFINEYRPNDLYRSDATNRLADCYYTNREFTKALAEYDRVASANNDERYYAQYKKAITLGILDRYDAKVELLRSVITRGEGDYVDDAMYELGRSYIAHEKYRDGAATLENFIEKYPQSPHYASALSYLGLAHLNLGDSAKSLIYYDMVVTKSPKSSEARDAMQGIREIYVERGEVDSFFDYAKKVGAEGNLTNMTRDSLSFISAQKIYISKRYELAAKSLRSYIKSYPKGYYITDALFYLSDCYMKQNDRDYAIEALMDLSTYPTNQYSEIALEQLSKMTFEDKRYDQAAVAYRKLFVVSNSRKDKEQAILGYVRSTLKVGDKDKIAAMAQDVASQKGAGDVAMRESQFAYAEQLREQKREAEALVLYKKLAVEVDSEQGAISHYRVIESLFNEGRLDDAEKAVYAYSDKKPSYAYWLARAYILLGDVYVAREDGFQARATYQSIADGYSPADDGIVKLAKERIAKLD